MTPTDTKIPRPKFLGPNQSIKVLLNGTNFHGGRPTVWKLPTKTKAGKIVPGAWMPMIRGKLSVCSSGYHLTYAPTNWWRPSAECKAYLAEYRGALATLDDDKIAVRSVRLLRELTVIELREVGIILGDGTFNYDDLVQLHALKRIYVGGETSLNDCSHGNVAAYEKADVKLVRSGNGEFRDHSVGFGSETTTLRAYDNSKVSANGRAWVSLNNSSEGSIGGSTTCNIYSDTAKLVMSGSSSVEMCFGGGTVIVNDSSVTVESDSGTITDNAGCVIRLSSSNARPKILMHKNTVVIQPASYRKGQVVYTSANPYPGQPKPKVATSVKAKGKLVTKAKK